MLKDQYDNQLSTASHSARDAYIDGLDRQLAGQAGAAAAFRRAVAADPNFALGWAGLARVHHVSGDIGQARDANAKARATAEGVSRREAAHIDALGLIIEGQAAYPAIRAHVAEHPRDALVAQTCSSVFGLIGFSGQPGREAELLAYNAALLSQYGEDWWSLSQYAFALCETGNLSRADELIDRAMTLRPDNAHGAHVRSHVWYETGETDRGIHYLETWLQDYDPGGVMFCHLNWHAALWSLEKGALEAMWARVDAAVTPEAGGSSPAINVVTDTASILHRAALAGVEVPQARWVSVSDYAEKAFPATGNAFVDVHAALAHAMAGKQAALARIMSSPAGPAADLVPDLAAGFGALATQDWSGAAAAMTRAMADLARIGGSRAQRDLVEQSLMHALLRDGRGAEARAVVALRRPRLANSLAA
ncbi:MAG: tetratricopeptide repeat protein [Pseudomonadota bacterium]